MMPARLNVVKAAKRRGEVVVNGAEAGMGRQLLNVALRVLLIGGLGVLGGILGATAGVAVAAVIAEATYVPSGAAPHESFFETVPVLLRAVGMAIAGAFWGTIIGAILGTSVGIWLARKVRRLAGPVRGAPAGVPRDPVEISP
jgi:ABC-type phosphate/phosphonate transport system permease subunit